jgi:hypothetical protein
MSVDYLNRASMEVYLTFAAIEGTCHKLLEANCAFRNGDQCKELIAEILEKTHEVVENIDRGLDADAIAGAMRRANGMQMACISAGDPRANGHGYYVEPEDMLTLVSGVMGPCLFCDLKEHEARECAVRKALLRSGVPNATKGGACPYMR